MADSVKRGETSASAIIAAAQQILSGHPEIRVEYFSIVDPRTLLPIDKIEAPC
jgi:pantothenate synthetase